MNKLLARIRRIILIKASSLGIYRGSWQDVEHFDPRWKARIKEMSQYIAPGECVADLGCGKMWLREVLTDNKYYPVDYKQRDENTFVADFNQYLYPDIKADVAFVSGTLEYITDYNWFVGQVSRMSAKCIVSYCTLEEYPSIVSRRRKAWQNHLSRAQVVAAFAEHGMKLVSENKSVPENHIFVFAKETAGT